MTTSAAPPTAVLRFLGGAGTVTGSRFLVEHANFRMLVDCGLFQGLKHHRLKNWEPFPIDPSTIDVVLLTHAHIDHSGYVPALTRQGFRGRVVCTHRTRELCEIVLPDAAHLQEEEARYANKKGYSKHRPALPLFTGTDAEAALKLFEGVAFHTDVVLDDDISCRFLPAAHILGSASILLEFGHGDAQRRLLISGDLGRGDHPFLGDPCAPPAADTVLVESTYGDRAHPDAELEAEKLAIAINESAARGGMILIPAFAVDRTEVVLSLVRDLEERGRIPRLPIFVDSPMAQRVLAVYRDALEAGDADLRVGLWPEHNLREDRIQECPSPAESKALAGLTYPSIIISASGMATGGRVLHHLARLLPDDRNAVVLAGFQAAGTRGRSLADGASSVKLLGRHVPVRAAVVTLESLSVHADADELVGWVSRVAGPPDTVFVVHGETSASDALSRRVREELNLVAVVPREGEAVLV